MKLRKGDTILITSGKDKGKRGKISKAFPESGKIIVEGLALVKKHIRPKKEGEKGQVVEIPKSFAASKAMLVCPKCGQAARIGFKLTDSAKFRICKKCQSEI